MFISNLIHSPNNAFLQYLVLSFNQATIVTKMRQLLILHCHTNLISTKRNPYTRYQSKIKFKENSNPNWLHSTTTQQSIHINFHDLTNFPHNLSNNSLLPPIHRHISQLNPNWRCNKNKSWGKSTWENMHNSHEIIIKIQQWHLHNKLQLLWLFKLEHKCWLV